jgi:hypothetical protein
MTGQVRIRVYLCKVCQPQWPRGLRVGSATVLFLGLRVRILPGTSCLSLVSVLCCQVEVSAMDRSFVQGNSTECDVSVILKPHEGGGLEPLRL